MGVMYVLVPVALVVVLVAVVAYVWAARRGQFDDLETPAIRALQDEPGEAKLGKARGKGGEHAREDRPPGGDRARRDPAPPRE